MLTFSESTAGPVSLSVFQNLKEKAKIGRNQSAGTNYSSSRLSCSSTVVAELVPRIVS